MFVRQYLLLALSTYQACGYTADSTPISTITTTPPLTTTPVPTTTLRNCVDYICPVNYANNPNPLSKHCLDPRGCSPTDCCLIITTTPVPTTTPLTCATFACPPPSVWHAIPGAVTCHGQCTKAVCCLDPTTTPVPTTTPPYGRKYAGQQDAMVHNIVASQRETSSHAWIMFALLAAAGFALVMGVAVVYRRGPRNTRQVDIVSLEDGAMSNDSDCFVE